MSNEKILYRKTRDIGDVFGASFKFIKQNFKPFYGSLLFFAGPFLLAGTLAYSYFANAAGISPYSYSQNLGNSISTFLGAFAIALTVLMFGISVYTVTLNKTLIVNETQAQGENLNISEIGRNFFNDFWRVLINMLLFSFVFIIVLGFFFLLMVGLVALFKIIAGSDMLLIVISVLLVIAFFLILFPILSFVPLAAFFVCQRDRINIFNATGKVLSYMKGNFWTTWVFSILALLTYSVMAFIVQLPVFILTAISTFSRLGSTAGQGVGEDSSSVTLILVTVVCSLIGYMVMGVFYLMCIYQYTSLEEKKEGSTLIENINQIV
ncbi:MAG TPA: hypothetical protein PL029_02665 [Bacteroidia bacterium]|nr:hypothetical protein [Bacteroidia bacterium]